MAGNLSLSRFLKQQPHSTLLISWELMVFKKDTENKWKLTQAAGGVWFHFKVKFEHVLTSLDVIVNRSIRPYLGNCF